MTICMTCQHQTYCNRFTRPPKEGLRDYVPAPAARV